MKAIYRWDTGEIIHIGMFNSTKELIEDAIRNHISLDYADLRGVNLNGICLEGASLNNVDVRRSYWGEVDFNEIFKDH